MMVLVAFQLSEDLAKLSEDLDYICSTQPDTMVFKLAYRGGPAVFIPKGLYVKLTGRFEVPLDEAFASCDVM
jgi:hypothetical protein